jgi:hypothetical protein
VSARVDTGPAVVPTIIVRSYGDEFARGLFLPEGHRHAVLIDTRPTVAATVIGAYRTREGAEAIASAMRGALADAYCAGQAGGAS